MTGWGQLSLRMQTALDRLAWGFGDLKRALVERGFWPAASHAVVASDGTRWSVAGSRLRSRTGGGRNAGLLVLESDCLWGSVQLPSMPRRNLDGAVQEALWRVSPLPPEQITAAWRAVPDDKTGGWAVDWGMCRRSAHAQWLAQHGLPEQALVYLARQGRALPVRSPAWQRLERRQGWVDGLAAGVLALVLCALALPALMPLVLKRQAVVRAVQHVSQLEPTAAPLRAKLDELRRQALLADELRKSASADLPLASVVEGLSAAIPNDTWLDRIEINGHEIRITGLTSNASELIAQLGRQPSLGDVRSTAANVRDSSFNKERFTLEMRWREGPKP